jgi:hypothetical protein
MLGRRGAQTADVAILTFASFCSMKTLELVRADLGKMVQKMKGYNVSSNDI